MMPAIPANIRFFLLVATALIANAFLLETAHAQLFGERTLGQPLSRRARAAVASPPATDSLPALDSAGSVQGDERFIRGNRSPNEFVGSERGSQQGFVGSEQAIGVGRVRTSVESLRQPPDRSAQINRPVPALPANAMYYPRLSVSTSEMASASYRSSVTTQRNAKLQTRLSQAAGSNIQVI